MKVDCLHGFFIFNETKSGEVSDFIRLTGLELVKWRNAYTLKGIENAPGFSVKGSPLLGFPAKETFEGEPWEVFEKNGVIFDFSKGIVAPITSISLTVKINPAWSVYTSNGLILPGSLALRGTRVKGYSGQFTRDTLRWVYSAVEYV